MKTASEISSLIMGQFVDSQEAEQLIKEYAEYVSKQTLKHACEVSFMKYHCGHFKTNTPTQYHQMGADNIQIDKDSILNTKIITP